MTDDAGIFFASTHNVVHSGSVVTVWIRWEYRTEQTSNYYLKYKSTVEREEIDCVKQASRVIAASFYPENNMDGRPTSSTYDGTKVAWDPAVPGTIGEYVATWVCNRFKPSH